MSSTAWHPRDHGSTVWRTEGRQAHVGTFLQRCHDVVLPIWHLLSPFFPNRDLVPRGDQHREERHQVLPVEKTGIQILAYNHQQKMIASGKKSCISSIQRQAIWTNAEIFPLGTQFTEIIIEIYTVLLRKCTWKCRLANGSHFASASMCSWICLVINKRNMYWSAWWHDLIRHE